MAEAQRQPQRLAQQALPVARLFWVWREAPLEWQTLVLVALDRVARVAAEAEAKYLLVRLLVVKGAIGAAPRRGTLAAAEVVPVVAPEAVILPVLGEQVETTAVVLVHPEKGLEM